MEEQKPDFNQGFFMFTYPYTWQGWLVWVLIFIVMAIGIVRGFLFSLENLVITLAMLPFLAIFSPTALEAKLHKMRTEAPQPEDLEAHALASGYNLTDWFYGHTEYVPTADPSDWVLPAPGPLSWFMQRPYHPDPGNEPLPEHPLKIGTPRPADLSSYGLFMLMFVSGMFTFAVFGITGAQASFSGGNNRMLLLPYITIGVGVVWLIMGYLKQRQQGVIVDTATKAVQGAVVGAGEYVGQVRPTWSGAMDVKVDGHPSRIVPGCVSYRWQYEVLIRERKVTYRNGRARITTVDRWRDVRSQRGDVPFLLHDGTGAIYTRPSTFASQDWGQYTKRWEASNRDTLRDSYWRFFQHRLHRSGQVLRHRWTIHALRLGNPVYALGMAEPRPHEELAWPGVNDVVDSETCKPPAIENENSTFWSSPELSKVDYENPTANARLHLIGKDTPGMPAMIKRGTELANIAKLRSRTELLFIPFITTVAGIFMLLLL